MCRRLAGELLLHPVAHKRAAGDLPGGRSGRAYGERGVDSCAEAEMDSEEDNLHAHAHRHARAQSYIDWLVRLNRQRHARIRCHVYAGLNDGEVDRRVQFPNDGDCPLKPVIGLLRRNVCRVEPGQHALKNAYDRDGDAARQDAFVDSLAYAD